MAITKRELYSYGLFLRICALLIITISLVVLVGWFLQIDFLLNIRPSWVTMKANTAICYILTGISIYLFSFPRLTSGKRISIVILNILLGLIALLAIWDNLFEENFVVNEILVKDYMPGVRPPGLMALVGGVIFFIYSMCCLGVISGRIRKGKEQYVLIIPFFIGLFSLYAYLYGAHSILLSQYLSVSFQNAVLVVLSSVALIFRDTGEGWVKIAVSKGPTGMFFRNLVVFNFIIFTLIAWLRVQGEKAGYFDVKYGITILTLSEMVIVLIVVLIQSRRSYQLESLVEESEKRLMVFIQEAPSAIAMMDKNMRYIAASKRWLSDYKIKGDVIGRSHYEVFPEISEEWKKIHQHCLQGYIEKNSRDAFVRLDGTVQWLRWEVKPWYDINENIGGILLSSDDITEDVNRENEVIRLNQQLKELNDQKDNLFSIIAHDLRGPLSGCNQFLNFVRSSKNDLTQDELFHYLDILQRHASTTYGLVEELLLWGRSQMRKIEFSPGSQDLPVQIKKVFSVYESIAREKQITLISEVPEPFPIFADENMLNAVLRNLISNSIKFTLPGGWVKVSAIRKPGLVEVRVSDNGVGMKDDDKQKILNKIYGHTSYGTKGEKGTGLGLILSRDFIEKHGGELKLETSLGKGTTFSFTLPLQN